MLNLKFLIISLVLVLSSLDTSHTISGRLAVALIEELS